MRWVYLVLLLAIVAVIVIFVFANDQNTTVKFLDQSFTAPQSWIFVAVYFLGMWSGGTVVGFLKRTYQHAIEPEQKGAS